MVRSFLHEAYKYCVTWSGIATHSDLGCCRCQCGSELKTCSTIWCPWVFGCYDSIYIEAESNSSYDMIKKILVAGSGANGMLLTGTLDDMEPWKEINVEKYQWITMAIGGMFSMAIDQHGNLHLWGNFNSKIIQNPIVYEMPTACRIWCGWEHGIILTTDGNLYGIGCNKYNQLSSSKKQYFVEPELILSKADVSDAFCGFRQTFIVADRILGCGSNRSGELGNGKLNTDGWIDIGKFNKIKKIQSSKKCLFILTEDGNLHIVGNNKIVPKLP